MSFDRNQLPLPEEYYRDSGLTLSGRGKWRTTRCVFHDGSDSMRINLDSGGFVCMSCGARGGDVLAYHMAEHGIEFIDAAKALGAWVYDGRPAPTRPTPIAPRAALAVLGFESMLVAVAAGNVARGVQLSDSDRSRLMQAAGRITRVVEIFR